MSMFKTSDFYLSAFLVASEVPMLDFEREAGRTSFEFAPTDGLSQLIDGGIAFQREIAAVFSQMELVPPTSLGLM